MCHEIKGGDDNDKQKLQQQSIYEHVLVIGYQNINYNLKISDKLFWNFVQFSWLLDVLFLLIYRIRNIILCSRTVIWLDAILNDCMSFP